LRLDLSAEAASTPTIVSNGAFVLAVDPVNTFA